MTGQESYRKIESVEKWGSGNRSQSYHAGKNGVKEIGEHMPRGPGDVCFYDVLMDDTSVVRIFSPDVVKMSKEIALTLPQKSIITPN